MQAKNAHLLTALILLFGPFIDNFARCEQRESTGDQGQSLNLKDLLPSSEDLATNSILSVNTRLEAGEVVIKGAKYRAFKSKLGTVYLPRLHYFTSSDIEMARCTSAEVDRSVVVNQGNSNLTDSSVFNESIPLIEVSQKKNQFKFYASIIQETIRKACGATESYRQDVPFNPTLEIGISYDDGDKEYTFFLSPLLGLLGFRVAF